MRSIRFKRWGVCAALALFGAALTCSSCILTMSEPVRVGVFPRPGCELIWIAKEKGFFKDEGIDVVVSQYSSWVGNLNAFSEGKLDISLQTLMSFVVSGSRGAVIAATDRSKGDVLVGKQSLKSLVDISGLQGRLISAEVGTDGYYMLASIIQKLGLAQRDINMVPLLTDDAVDSFVRGDIQAVYCYPPYVTKALKRGNGRVLFSQDFNQLSPCTVIVASNGFLSRRPGDAGRFLRAWFRAVEYYQQHRDEAVGIMAAAECVSPAEFSESLRDIKVFDLQESERFMTTDQAAESIYAIRTFLKKIGFPVGKIDVQKIVNPSFIRKKRL
ncbi:MAG TPA: ABC transporter substrate-binding protein [bacterium]|nr:ABC transporter substrate-binding protein [bacterium]